MPLAEARISPMDRGFLFGDGIYEVIPSFGGKPVGFRHHIERLSAGLRAIGIAVEWTRERWQELCWTLIERHPAVNVGVYLQVSRGMAARRMHAFPENANPTVFAYAFDIPDAPIADKRRVKVYRVSTARDMRWRRCDIKSTSLLGNVLHFQHGFSQGNDETILYNELNWLTEASASNVYAVKNGTVITPPLSHEILPGVTRAILLDILKSSNELSVEERPLSMAEVFAADEVWLSSSSTEIVPV